MNTDIKKIKTFNDESEIINKIIVGDCLEAMKKIKDNTFDMIFADPPYNMQLQNELYRPNNTKVDAVDDEWDKFNGFGHYDEFSKAWLQEAKRVLKKKRDNLGYWFLSQYFSRRKHYARYGLLDFE